MRVQLIAVGTKMPAWVQTGYEEYAKRLPKELCPKLVELAIGHRPKNGSVSRAIKLEGEAILQVAPKTDRLVALEVKGKAWSTEKLAENLENWQMDGANLSFLIGGPDGLSQACLDRADQKWSLSNLTLPHPLVRVIFIEQLYRAWTVLQHHPYHK